MNMTEIKQESLSVHFLIEITILSMLQGTQLIHIGRRKVIDFLGILLYNEIKEGV